jgi:hypothetical protein
MRQKENATFNTSFASNNRLQQCFSAYASRHKFILSRSSNKLMNKIIINSYYFNNGTKQYFFVNADTCGYTLAILAWPTCYNNDTGQWPGLPTFQRSGRRNYPFLVDFIVRLSKFSQLQECLANHGNIQIYKIKKINSRWKSHKKSHSTYLRLMQNM